MFAMQDPEKIALCPHTFRSKEVIAGQKTGDTVCNECGEIFMPREEITPPELRSDMITTAHALLIAMRLNKNLKIKSNFKTQHGSQYKWILANEDNSTYIPVHSDAITKCTSHGLLKL